MPRDLPDPTTHQLAQASGPGAQPIGRVDTVTGTVTAQHVDGSTVTLEAGASVYQKDLIATQAGAKVALVFADKTTFALGESGQLRLDELVYDPAGKSGKMGLAMLKGAFAFVSGDIAGTQSDAMVVRTPVGTIGIRGTAVAGNIDPSGGGSTVAAVPDPSGAPSIIAFTNAAGTRIFSENTMISVQTFFTTPSDAFSTAGQNLGEAGDLSFIAGAIASTVNPGGSVGPTGGARPPTPGAGAQGDAGGSPIHVTLGPLDTTGLDAPIGLFTLPPIDRPPTTLPPPPPPPSHPHFDNEVLLGAPQAPQAPQGFIGTVGLPNDNFVGRPGVTNVFDFVTNHNSLESGDRVVGAGPNDTLNALFDKPFTIDATLTITNVPHINLQLGGGPSSLDALGITSGPAGPSTITVTGTGALTVTDLRVNFDGHALADALNVTAIGSFLTIVAGNGNDSIQTTGPTAGHDVISVGGGNDTVRLGDQAGFDVVIAGNGNDSIFVGSPNDIVLVGNGNDTISIGGGFDSVAAGRGNDSITISGSGDFLSVGVGGVGIDTVSVSGASDTVVAAGGHATITVSGANDVVSVVAGSNRIVGAGSGDVLSYAGAPSAVTINLSTGLVTHGSFTDTISGSSFTQVVGSAFNDVITTVDNTVSVTGGGGADTVHLGGTSSNHITLHGATNVDVVHPASSTDVTVDLLGQAVHQPMGVGVGWSFDLHGGGTTQLTFNLIGPTSFDFFDVNGKGTGGSTFLHGVQTLTLHGGSYNLAFDDVFFDLQTIDASALGPGQTLTFNDNGFFGGNSFDVIPGAGADTLHGQSGDKLDYSHSSQPVTLTLTSFNPVDGIGDASGFGQGGTAAGDVFTHFGTLKGSGAMGGSTLVIASGSGLAHSDIIDLGGGFIRYHFGSNSVGISGFSSVVNQSGVGLQLKGNGLNDTITGGTGGDTLFAHTGANHFDNFNYLAVSDSYSNASAMADTHTDRIMNFQDSGTTLDFTTLAGVGHQTFDGARIAETFVAAFGSDSANTVAYVQISGNTYVHAAGPGGGYSAGDLLIQIAGNHPLMAANFHLHA